MATTEKKITKAEKLDLIIKAFTEGVTDEEQAIIIEFAEAEKAALAKRAEKERERAAEKRRENDELRKTVQSVLTNEFQTLSQIVAAIGDEDVTASRVTPRLTQLIKDGIAEKTQVKEDTRKVTAYKLV